MGSQSAKLPFSSFGRRGLKLLGMRRILKDWKLSAIAAFSLTVAMALGIVAFAIADILLLRPPMAKNPRELVAIFASAPKEPFGRISFPDYEYYREGRKLVDTAQSNRQRIDPTRNPSKKICTQAGDNSPPPSAFRL